ncbi:MAG: hypothetical protein GDA42_12485 [Ekhidna sp.]|nr:hypothetical protein [Ekhidna sp.]
MSGHLRSVTPFYGVAVGFSADGRNGNGFVGGGCFPCGDEGFRVVLRPSEEREEKCEDYEKGTF